MENTGFYNNTRKCIHFIIGTYSVLIQWLHDNKNGFEIELPI